MASAIIQTTRPLRMGVIGPKGQCGSCIVNELLDRGHTVVGLSRDPPKIWKNNPAYSAIAVDVNNHADLTKVFSQGFDAIVSAYGPPMTDLSMTYYYGVESNLKIKVALLESTHKGPFIIVGKILWDVRKLHL